MKADCERAALESDLLALFARGCRRAAGDAGGESGRIVVEESPTAAQVRHSGRSREPSPSSWTDGAGETNRAAESVSLISDERFNELALRVFRYQYEASPILRCFWTHRGATPEAVRHWTEIPGVPTAAFKEAPLCAFPPGE